MGGASRQWDTTTPDIILLTRYYSKASAYCSVKPSGELLRGHGEMGSLAGAAHLRKGSAGVLRLAQRGRKPLVEHKGKS